MITETNMFCLISPICYLEMTEGSEECGEMFNEVDDGEWDIRDDHDDEVRSDSGKEWDKVTAIEMKRFQL